MGMDGLISVYHSMDDDLPKRIGLADMDGSKYLTFGSAFILAVDSALFPLDTLKTILMSNRQKKQSNGSKKIKEAGIVKLMIQIARNEGIGRFWKGMTPSVIGSFPGQASYFLAYESTQEVLKRFFPDQKTESQYLTFAKGFISGFSAEIAGGLFYVPADIVAQRLQIQTTKGFVHNSRLYAGPTDVIQKIFRAEGYMGFYRGYFAYINAYAPGTAVQWGTYELFKGIGWRVATWFETTMERPWQSSSQKETAVNACSGGIAATCAICANNPLEILRIRTQLLESRNKKDAETIKAGYWKLARKILQEEGWQAFYRGLRVRLMVTVPSAMVALSGYEAIKTWSADS